MSTKDWKNNELKTLLSEKWGFSFNLLTESQDEEVVEEAAEEETLNEEEEEELDEGAASSGRQSPHADRRGDDERKRPMEEGEKMPMKDEPEGEDLNQDGKKGHGKVPAFLDKDDAKKKEDKDDDKEEKSDKDLSKVPPQLRKHVKGKIDEQQIRQIIRKLVKEAMAKKEG